MNEELKKLSELLRDAQTAIYALDRRCRSRLDYGVIDFGVSPCAKPEDHEGECEGRTDYGRVITWKG